MELITFPWSWRGTPVPVGYEVSDPAGGEQILMLPAMSTVSTRDELRALAHHLGSRRCIITDWPGFGDTARPRLDYDRALCRGFLEELVAHLQGELERRSFPVVACGHAAGYAIDLVHRRSQKSPDRGTGCDTMATCARGLRLKLPPVIVLGSRRSWRIATAAKSMLSGRGSCC
jgi:pimeloyl-ACP methyl ester carboxylesterase